jgi:hypothetical protein
MNRFFRNFNAFLIGIILICAIALLAGCGTAKPYATASLGYQIDGMSDWYVQTSRDWQCSSNVQFNGELGVELPGNWSIASHHRSWVFCGKPFGDGKPELYQDDIRTRKNWGAQ